MVRQPANILRLSDQDLIDVVSGETTVVRLRAGEVLFKNGDPSGGMYVVRSGSLTIRSGSIVYEDVGPGGMVEPVMPRSAMVYALTDAEVIEIDPERFLALIEEVRGFALAVMHTLSRRLRRMDVRYDAKRDDL